MKMIFQLVLLLLVVIYAAIISVERPGDGPAKKQEALHLARALLEALALPGWLKTAFGSDTILGFLIDVTVTALNKTGWVKTLMVDVSTDPLPVPGG